MASVPGMKWRKWASHQVQNRSWRFRGMLALILVKPAHLITFDHIWASVQVSRTAHSHHMPSSYGLKGPSVAHDTTISRGSASFEHFVILCLPRWPMALLKVGRARPPCPALTSALFLDSTVPHLVGRWHLFFWFQCAQWFGTSRTKYSTRICLPTMLKFLFFASHKGPVFHMFTISLWFLDVSRGRGAMLLYEIRWPL